MAPFVEMCREMLEMRYLWNTPVELDREHGAAGRVIERREVASTMKGCGQHS